MPRLVAPALPDGTLRSLPQPTLRIDDELCLRPWRLEDLPRGIPVACAVVVAHDRLVEIDEINPPSVPEPVGGYANGLRVTGFQRMLFISGQIPQDRRGHVPADIEEQCRLVWAHILAVLGHSGMDVQNLVKVTTYLADRAHAAANTAVRNEILGAHRPALTVIIAEIWDPAWLIEIEATAAA